MAVSFTRQADWILRDKYEGRISRLPDKDRQQLKNGCPLDYIIGWKPFLNCRIDLRFQPLIPRPETEFWVGRAIGEIKKSSGKKKVLDIFAGSGCAGIAVLKNAPDAKVDFAEKNTRFIKQIKLNLAMNGIPAKKSRIIKSDVFKKITGRYDFILANPPYIPLKDKKKVSAGVKRFEPANALFAGQDGLAIISRFLRALKNRLAPDGRVWLEFNSSQKNKIAALLKENRFENYEFHRDQFGRWRWAIIFNSAEK
ncbi:MAG: HemK family protein methyltransferase [Candidatus Portnoybacteria bacterium]|nr:HemK family protein methyltransferase [Candidatus Portnoybacteria bacterium]